MVRVSNLGKNVEAWCDETGEGASTRDLCYSHWCELARDPHAWDEYLIPQGSGEPEGEDGWGGDVAHPDYDEAMEGEEYRCALDFCREMLWEFWDGSGSRDLDWGDKVKRGAGGR